MIQVERIEDVSVVRLAHGPANALDAEVMDALADALDEVEASGVRAVMLTGSGSVFSAGADLFRVLEEGEAYLDRARASAGRCFGRLFAFPLPIVAAINGHAIAGGCVLACTCDRRIAAAGGLKMGLAELRVGVPFPALGVEIVRSVVAPPHLERLVYDGAIISVEEARDAGLVDEIVEAERLAERALAVARRLGAIPKETFRITKRRLRAPFLERIDRRPDDEARRAWGSEEVRAAISRFLVRTFGTDRRT